MSAPVKAPPRAVLSLAELLSDHPQPEPCLIEPGLLPSQGILFLGGEPKAGKSLLVANLALALAAGGQHAGFNVPSPKRVLICQFELPTPQFALRLATMRKAVGSRADSNLFVDTRVSGHMLSSTAGLNHFRHSAFASPVLGSRYPLVLRFRFHSCRPNSVPTQGRTCRCPTRPPVRGLSIAFQSAPPTDHSKIQVLQTHRRSGHPPRPRRRLH